MINLSSTSQESVVSVDIPSEPTCGLKEGRAYGKSKAPSIDALEPCMAMLEITLSIVQNTFEGLEEMVDGFKGEYADFTVATKAFIQDQANDFRGEFRAFCEELLKLYSFVQEELWAVRAEVKEVRSYWEWHKLTLSASSAFTSMCDARHIDMPKADIYDDMRNATVVDNFFFKLDQYFDVMGVWDEVSKVGITPIYLQGIAQLWWRHKYDKIGKGIWHTSSTNSKSNLSLVMQKMK